MQRRHLYSEILKTSSWSPFDRVERKEEEEIISLCSFEDSVKHREREREREREMINFSCREREREREREKWQLK